MWRKVGAIGPTSNNDNKSNRSRDQNPIEQPFSQMTKQRMSQSQIFFEGNDYFFNNHMKKMKDDSSKHTSQQTIKFNKLTHARSHKQLPSQYGKIEVRKKTLNFDQMEQLSTRFNEEKCETNREKGTFINGDQKIKATQSTERIQSSTSIDNNVKILKQCQSTPQLNLPQIKTITEQIPLHKRIQTKKSIDLLRKQHSQIKKSLESELTQFSNEFHSIQVEMNNKISQMIQSRAQNSSAINEKEVSDKIYSNKLKSKQIMPETTKFADKFKSLNSKKKELAEKYKSFKIK